MATAERVSDRERGPVTWLADRIAVLKHTDPNDDAQMASLGTMIGFYMDLLNRQFGEERGYYLYTVAMRYGRLQSASTRLFPASHAAGKN